MVWTSERVRELRRRLGKTQPQLAADLGVTARTVKRYEDDGPPRDEALFQKLDALDQVADEGLSPKMEVEPAARVLREKLAAAALDLEVEDLLTLHAMAKRMQVKRLVSLYADTARDALAQVDRAKHDRNGAPDDDDDTPPGKTGISTTAMQESRI